MNSHVDKKEALNIWALLEKSLREIFSSNEGKLSFEELYRNAYTLVLYKYGDLLYDGVEMEIKQNLQDVANDLLRVDDDGYLRDLVEKWDYFTLRMDMIKDVLMYMDINYVSQVNCLPVYDLGLSLFRQEIVDHNVLGPKMIDQALHLITRERQGEIVPKDLIRKLLVMLVDVGVDSKTVYEKKFENRFLEETKGFYRKESSENIRKDTISDYMNKVEKRIEEEESRAKTYLNDATEKKLMEVCRQEMLKVHLETIIKSKSGAMFMFENACMDDLKRMYRLLKPVKDAILQVRAEFLEYVKTDGQKLVEEYPDDKTALEFVGKLLEKRAHYEAIANEAFDKVTFALSLKEGFKFVVNFQPTTCQYVVLFIDDIMKAQGKGKSIYDTPKALEEIFLKVLTIFNHFEQRDMFEDYYKQLLSKRLLMKQRHEIAFEAERLMIARLKGEIGAEFTKKLEQMLTDVDLSEEETKSFKIDQDISEQDGLVGNFDASVLNKICWPHQPTRPCVLPEMLQRDIIDRFTEYYTERHKCRKLDWLFNLGTAEIRVALGHDLPKDKQKTYTLIVSTYQMLILQLFNDKSELSFQDIMKLSDIPLDELRRHLISLAAPKFQILVKEPKGKIINDEDVFSVNEKFFSKSSRVRIPLVSVRTQLKKEKPVPMEVSANVLEDRKAQIDAAITRILKARKALQHTSLITEVQQILAPRFRPTVTEIKDRIDKLIDRDYIERDEEDQRVYKYVE